MNVLKAAKTRWGKSYSTQATVEANAAEYDKVVIMDYKNEYRGLDGLGLTEPYPVGPDEHAGATAAGWESMIEENDGLRLQRYRLTDDEWSEAMGPVATAVRNRSESVLLVVDEAHFVAPQRTGYPDSIKGIATTGDGEGVSAIWVTQRPAELDETIIAQCQSLYLGGFSSSADLNKIGVVVEYDVDVHNVLRSEPIDYLPEELHHPTDGPVPLQMTEENGQVTGSEWIYSAPGELERFNSRRYSMRSTHYGGNRKDVKRP